MPGPSTGACWAPRWGPTPRSGPGLTLPKILDLLARISTKSHKIGDACRARPVADCVLQRSGTQFDAFFEYDSALTFRTIPVGTRNQMDISGATLDARQPTEFLGGAGLHAFTVPFDGLAAIRWTLDGQTATLGSDAPRCSGRELAHVDFAERVALFGTESVDIGDYVSVLSPAGLPSVVSNGDIVLGADVVVGDIVAGGHAAVGSETLVQGSVTTGHGVARAADAVVKGSGKNGVVLRPHSIAVGVDYSDDQSARTFAHELGHVFGRSHSPCNAAGDPLYPYRAGGIGSWGWDLLDQTLKDPGSYKDLMGYCSPVWISDYVYGHLQSYLIEAASPAASPTADAGAPLDGGAADAITAPDAAAAGAPSAAQRALEASGDFLTLLVEPGASSRWAARRRVRAVPGGIRETADVLDRDGRVVDSVSVRRVRALDVAREYVYVPAPSRRT